MQLSPHFTLAELTHSDKAKELGIDNTPNDEIIERLKIVCCRILEPVRDHYSIAFAPNSGYRCQALNTALHGSKTSQHMQGQAVDFEVPGVANYDLALWISTNLVYDQLILENYTQGIPNSGWVHCSIVSGKNRMQCLTIKGSNKKEGLHK
jgi:hypothetical protein